MKSEPRGGTTYVFVIRGELDDRYRHLFEGMEMEHNAGATVVVGPVRDQAEFYGLVERIQELGLDLISAQQATTSPAGSGQDKE